MSEGLLLPHIDAVNRPFWDGCREGVLRVQQCPSTKRLMFPPRPVNSWTPGVPPTWTEVSGRGTIWSVIEPHPPLMLDYADLAPYNAIVVALAEDPAIRLVGNLVPGPGGAINTLKYDDIEIGSAVKVVFERVDDQVTLPLWMLLER